MIDTSGGETISKFLGLVALIIIICVLGVTEVIPWWASLGGIAGAAILLYVLAT